MRWCSTTTTILKEDHDDDDNAATNLHSLSRQPRWKQKAMLIHDGGNRNRNKSNTDNNATDLDDVLLLAGASCVQRHHACGDGSR